MIVIGTMIGSGIFIVSADMARLINSPGWLLATVRNIPQVDEYDGPGKCLVTGETVDRRVVVAKSY